MPTGSHHCRIAVVGHGYRGSKHARVLSSIPDVAVTVVEAHPDRLVQVTPRLSSTRASMT
jgi:predicted dehydrogenase